MERTIRKNINIKYSLHDTNFSGIEVDGTTIRFRVETSFLNVETTESVDG